MSALGYDSRGNIVADGAYTYGYSSENLLTSLANPTPGAIQSSSTYAYDPLMRLAVINSSNDVLDASLGYDGQDFILEGLSNNRTRRYVRGPGVDEPLVAYLVTSAGTSRLWYQADERGSITRLTNDSGTPGGIGKYDEYGVGGTGRIRYAGQYWLADGNLLYSRARIYDAKLGRFLQPDPIGYGGGMNMYAYVGGDPVNNVDPSGLCTYVNYGWYNKYTNEYLGPAGAELSGCEGSSLGWGPTSYFSGDIGGNGGGRSNQCPASGNAAGTIAIPIPKAPGSAVNTAAATGILRWLGVLGLIFSLSGDSAKQYTPIFRAVGPDELLQIKATGQFGPSPSGFQEKQFWLALPDAQWFARQTVARGWEKSSTIVTTGVTDRTLSFGKIFYDAGHKAISFPQWALSAVNFDAKETGIHVIESCGG